MMVERPATWTRQGGELPKRDRASALMRGACHRCPTCGKGALYRAYLKTVDACSACGEPLHHHRADDAPPYFTIAIVGKIIVPLVLLVEQSYKPDLWLQAAVWPLLAVILTLVTLPMVKGALVGYQWALYMHGFDPRSGGDESWDGVGFQSWRDGP